MRARASGVALLVVVAASLPLLACGSGDEVGRSPATVRAERRLYDGAPPVVAHTDFGMTCTQCHNERGIQVEGVGYAPASPHEATRGMSAMSRCRQCHVFQLTDETFVANSFAGLRQDLRAGRRLNDLSPPTIPHKVFMRENCAACHTGTAAREEIRTSHPDRLRCRQCHVPANTSLPFVSPYPVPGGMP